MKIALDWIGEYLSPVPAAEAAADALMNAGLPVESIVEVEGVKGKTKVLDVEVTSNRTDCFSHVGLARELSALTGGNFRMPTVKVAEHGAAASGMTGVTVEDAGGCPYYSARVIRNVKVGPSPAWLVKRVESIGLRSVNNVVDVTNFVLMELGQPLHAFDLDTLAEQRIVVRRARKGEKFLAIDGKEYGLDASMLVIADAEKAVAIAGVMGGKGSEVTEMTTTVLLESARFEPLTIRTTSRTLGLKSDSSYRFERGIDPSMAELASRRAAELIVQVAGGEVAPGVVTVGTAAVKVLPVSMRMERFRQIMGIAVSEDRVHAILCALGFSPVIENGMVTTRVPPHRLDVDREIDLVEEIARVYGYNHVPTLDRVSHPVRPEPVEEKAGRAIREAFVAAGFSEAVTVTFVPEAEAGPFVAEGAALIRTQHGGWKGDVLRPTLFPSLLAARRINQNSGTNDARLFEKAEVFSQAEGGAAPTLRRTIAAVATDVSGLTGLITLLMKRLNPALRAAVMPVEGIAYFVAGTSGEVRLADGTVIGRVGLFTPETQKKYDLRQTVGGLELDWSKLIGLFEPVRRANAVPRFPGVKRDLSVVVDEAMRWAEVETSIVAAKLAHLEGIDFVTTFRNKQVGEGKKSLTLALDFRDPGRTLKSEEVDAQVATAVRVLGEKFGAVLRA